MSELTIDSEFLKDRDLQHLFDVLDRDGETLRINGGAVRNALLGEAIGDVDLSTTLEPKGTMERLKAADIKVLPTGFDHGTVTAILGGKSFEITSLREDVETDGRRAVVRYGRDWTHDAQRRDFTMNALYADRRGKVFDPLAGIEDLRARRVRFIGDAGQRIEEDYLRILRFFRFFAYYGDGRPDADGIRACVRLRDGLSGLSAERIWQEMRKLFAAPDPSRAILWMRQTGVLTLILPESEKWGIDSIHSLMKLERAFGWQVDPVIRLMSITPQRDGPLRDIAKRWKIANTVRDRMVAAMAVPALNSALEGQDLQKMFYRFGAQAVRDRLMLAALPFAPDSAAAKSFDEAIKASRRWVSPVFPVTGADLKEKGMAAGPAMGQALKQMESRWIESGFSLTRDELLLA